MGEEEGKQSPRTFLEAFSTSFLTNMAGRSAAQTRDDVQRQQGTTHGRIKTGQDQRLLSSPEEEAGRAVADFVLFRSGIGEVGRRSGTKPTTKARQ